jgi:hypothetical protein
MSSSIVMPPLKVPNEPRRERAALLNFSESIEDIA